ncbi:MAG: hypothetical protein JRG86_08915 [Deltaproteobacteria bacterium]|nr:hypothetical protein [Deltaproteobacteria bacterium]MBW2498334.1 hypothetical protein [Deltaproteobacteria bacterium]
MRVLGAFPPSVPPSPFAPSSAVCIGRMAIVGQVPESNFNVVEDAGAREIARVAPQAVALEPLERDEPL